MGFGGNEPEEDDQAQVAAAILDDIEHLLTTAMDMNSPAFAQVINYLRLAREEATSVMEHGAKTGREGPTTD